MGRHFWVRHESDRAAVGNDGTMVMPLLGSRLFASRAPSGDAPRSFEDAFRRVHAEIGTELRRRTQPGLAVFIVDDAGLEASAWTAAAESDFEVVLVGRHNHADLFLPTDPRLSLRHLAVMLHPSRPDRPVRFRVIDLRTGTAFADEEGRRLESVEAEGPLMLRCASFAVLMFPTDETAASWPEDPDEAWARIPPRVYVEAQDVAADHGFAWVGSFPLPRVERRPRWSDSTQATTSPGPILPSLALQVGETACGELRVRSETGRVALRTGHRGLRRGLLLGRYDRCDTGTLPVLSAAALSRVHLLVIELDGVLLAVDTASKNGTRLDGRRVRCARVEPGRSILLADAAEVEWRFLH